MGTQTRQTSPPPLGRHLVCCPATEDELRAAVTAFAALVSDPQLGGVAIGEQRELPDHFRWLAPEVLGGLEPSPVDSFARALTERAGVEEGAAVLVDAGALPLPPADLAQALLAWPGNTCALYPPQLSPAVRAEALTCYPEALCEGRIVGNPTYQPSLTDPAAWLHQRLALVRERARLEAELEDARARAELLFRHAFTGIAVYRPTDDCEDYEFVDLNPAGELASHVRRDEIVGRRLTEVFPGAAELGLLEALRTAWETGERVDVPLREYRDERLREWVENRIFRTPAGQLYALYEDTSRLHLTEARLRSLFETTLVPILVANERGLYIDANPAALAFFECSLQELVGQSPEVFRAPEGRPLESTRRPGRWPMREVQFTIDGRRKTLIVDIVEVPSQTGPLYYAIGQDVTELNLAREELARQLRFQEQLLESIPVPVFHKDADLCYRACNHAFCELVGVDAEDLLGRRAAERLPTEFAAIDERCDRQLLGEGGHAVGESPLPGPNGAVREVFFHKALLLEPDGSPAGIIGAIVDITARKEMVAQLLGQRRRLRELAMQLEIAEERERRRIAAYLHDEIGQALTVLRMRLTSELARDPTAPRHEEALETIDNLIREVRALTGELSPAVLYELGLAAAIEWLAERVGRQHGLAVRVVRESWPNAVPEDLGVVLFRVVRELLHNVVKHARATRIAVTLQAENGILRIKVEDNGVGFAVEQAMARSERAETFGLYSIRERLEHVGGRLVIHSQPGGGAVAEVLAPAGGGERR